MSNIKCSTEKGCLHKAYVHAVIDNFSRRILGQPPDEMEFGRGDGIPDQLAGRCHEARQKRLEPNDRAVGSHCPRTGHEDLAA
jgi:hypothetical protein